jgi:hypothetical protein
MMIAPMLRSRCGAGVRLGGVFLAPMIKDDAATRNSSAGFKRNALGVSFDIAMNRRAEGFC